MKMIVVTTITTLDIESMDTSHSVEIEDQDGLSEVSSEALGALLIGALDSTLRGVREKFPRVARIEEQAGVDL